MNLCEATWQGFKPWRILSYSPDGKPASLGSYFLRGDAEKHLAFLRRTLPDRRFSLLFQPPEEE